jgi:methyl-accepting chemotaxis protein
VAQASSAIEEMLANIQSVTNTLVKNGDNVKALSKASEVGRSGLMDVAQDIKEISKESEGLLEINAVMENIASQTNLLSMNAAIEAAHAGESGKGFAVVADEIRKLAENSGEQSKTISAVLKKIAASIGTITTATDDVLSRFEAITTGIKTVAEQEDTIRAAMEEQMAGSKQILAGVAKVNEITGDVKNGAQVMLEGSQQVITESRNLESATQEITGGMNEMAAGADQINTAVEDVNKLSAHNRDGISVLMGEVAKFKVENLRFDYDTIVAKHRKWIDDLRNLLDGEKINLSTSKDAHKNCALGQWIYGEGKQFSSLASYKVLEKTHEQFHAKAGDIIALKRAGKTMEAEKGYLDLMDYYHKIISALDELKIAK